MVQSIKERGFGFIKVPGEGKDYFFHRSEFNGYWDDLVRDWTENPNIQVEFEPRKEPNGRKRAINVVRVDWPNQVDGVNDVAS